MIKLASGLFLASIALVPFAGMEGRNNQSGHYAASANSQIIYRIVASSGDSCVLMLQKVGGSQSHQASPQADCASLDQRVDAIRKWDENRDGTISLVDYAGHEVMRLEASGANAFKSADLADLELSFRPIG